MKEAYCSYEISKILKEKGFDEPCYQKYDDEGYLSSNHVGYINSEKPCNDFCALAPTHQMACAWLREKHFIIVVTPVLFNVNYEDSKWGYDIWADDNLEVSAEDCSNPLKSYEEATEMALKYVLENLI